MTDALTMGDLYPNGRGYHSAHEPYIAAVVAALDAAGFPVDNWSAEPNDPRDGFAELNLNRQAVIDGKVMWPHDEVAVCWQEERGWWVLTVTKFDEPRLNKGNWQTDQRNVFELGVATVASPATVVLAVAEKAGLTLELADDGHPDLDFPDHHFEESDVALELALRHYAAPKETPDA